MDIIYTEELIFLFEEDCINIISIERNKAPPKQFNEKKITANKEDEPVKKSHITNEHNKNHRLIAQPKGQETVDDPRSLNQK